MRDVVIVSGARTAVGSFGGSLKGVRVVDMGALVIREAIRRAGLRPEVSDAVRSCRPDVFGDAGKTDLQKKHYDYPDAATPVYFDECIMGNVIQAGLGQNPGRQAGIFAGLPQRLGAPHAGIRIHLIEDARRQPRGRGRVHRPMRHQQSPRSRIEEGAGQA